MKIPAAVIRLKIEVRVDCRMLPDSASGRLSDVTVELVVDTKSGEEVAEETARSDEPGVEVVEGRALRSDDVEEDEGPWGIVVLLHPSMNIVVAILTSVVRMMILVVDVVTVILLVVILSIAAFELVYTVALAIVLAVVVLLVEDMFNSVTASLVLLDAVFVLVVYLVIVWLVVVMVLVVVVILLVLSDAVFVLVV